MVCKSQFGAHRISTDQYFPKNVSCLYRTTLEWHCNYDHERETKRFELKLRGPFAPVPHFRAIMEEEIMHEPMLTRYFHLQKEEKLHSNATECDEPSMLMPQNWILYDSREAGAWTRWGFRSDLEFRAAQSTIQHQVCSRQRKYKLWHAFFCWHEGHAKTLQEMI